MSTVNEMIASNLKLAASYKSQARNLRVALENFHADKEDKTSKGTKAMATIGRASVRAETAKTFVSVNPAQTIDVIKGKALKLQKLMQETRFIDACRETALQSDVKAALEHCDAFLELWNKYKGEIRAAAKAA